MCVVTISGGLRNETENDTIQGKERSARGQAQAASSAGYARGAKAASSAGYAIPRGALKALSTVSLHGPGRLYAMLPLSVRTGSDTAMD